MVKEGALWEKSCQTYFPKNEVQVVFQAIFG